METRIEIITPEKASEWLTKNRSNRPLSNKHVIRLASAITNDEWVVNGESVKFNGDDALVDGQHRLNAVIRAGKPIKSYVVRGLGNDAYDTIDQGKARMLGDVLARAGKEHYTRLASATRWSWALTNDCLLGASSVLTSTFLHNFLDSNPKIEKSVKFVSQFVREITAPHGMLAALHFIFSQRSAKHADEFIAKILTGENLTRSMIEYKLRALLISESRSARRAHIENIAIVIIKA